MAAGLGLGLNLRLLGGCLLALVTLLSLGLVLLGVVLPLASLGRGQGQLVHGQGGRRSEGPQPPEA